MGFLSILSFAHRLVQERVRPGDLVVDATIGNGLDTAFLARLVGPTGTVHGFDIQPEALARTRERLEAEPAPEGRPALHLHLRSHAEMLAAVPEEAHGQAAAVMFNLGYLPRGDHRIVTVPASTLPALAAALKLLRPGGIVTAVVYPGHEGGDAEAEAVERWAAELAQASHQAMTYRLVNQRNRPPFLVAVEARTGGASSE